MEIKASKSLKTYYYYRLDKESTWIRMGENEYFQIVENNKNKATKIEHDADNQVSYMDYDMEIRSHTDQPMVMPGKPKGCMSFGLFAAILIAFFYLLK